jgi:hypothetical protein
MGSGTQCPIIKIKKLKLQVSDISNFVSEVCAVVTSMSGEPIFESWLSSFSAISGGGDGSCCVAVNTNSANWAYGYSAATVYASNSATYATDGFVVLNFLPLSGGDVTGNINLNSHNLNSVGILCAGNVISINTISANGGNSDLWNDVITTVRANSSINWDYQGNDIHSLTANWENTFTNVKNSSAEWNSVYNDFNSQSANNNRSFTVVHNNSAEWNSVYNDFNSQSGLNLVVNNTVISNSAVNWNYQGTDIKALSSNWQDTFTVFGSQSANNNRSFTVVHNNSAEWNNVYNDFNSQSGINLQINTAVISNSADWNYQGTDIKTLTSNWQDTFNIFGAQSALNTNTYTTVNTESANWESINIGTTTIVGGTSGRVLTSGATIGELSIGTSANQIVQLDGSGKLPAVDGSNLTILGNVVGDYAPDTGSTNAYVTTPSPAPSAYVTGVKYCFRAASANTGACTINISGLGAKSIVKAAGGITTALVANDILSGQMCILMYDGTNMQIVSTLGNAGGGGSFDPTAPGPIGGTTPNTSVFTSVTTPAIIGDTSAGDYAEAFNITAPKYSRKVMLVTGAGGISWPQGIGESVTYITFATGPGALGDVSLNRIGVGIMQINDRSGGGGIWEFKASSTLPTPSSGAASIGSITASGVTQLIATNSAGVSTQLTGVKLAASATLNFPSTAAGAVSDLTISVTGAAVGDVVSIGIDAASVPAAGSFFAWVSAADTVTVRYSNNSLVTAYDPPSGTFKVIVFKS